MNETTYDLDELRRNPVSRRAFFTRMTAAGLGIAAASLLASTNIACGGGDDDDNPNAGFTDPTNFPGVLGRSANEVVLNYALTLELLEADLYRQALNAASGRELNTPLGGAPAGNSTGEYTLSVGSGGLSTGAANAGFLYLVQYAYVEAAHRDFLATALSSMGAPVTTANSRGYQLPAGAGTDLSTILQAIYAVEETGVRAYLGAAPFMSFATPQDKSLLATAVAIHSTEARHSGAIAYVLGLNPGPVYSIPGVVTGRRVTDGGIGPNTGTGISEDTFQYYSDPVAVLGAVRPFIVGA
ncbi:MAG: ferritin-like domain-containing protein [Akkermansiaceae bacterium]|nr:ferritin-like domain-containing protein [Armatimonadota bacterium]